MFALFIVILLPRFISTAEICNDRVIDLNKGNFSINDVVFFLNQTCEWKFIVPNDSFITVRIHVENFYECWYEVENALGKTAVGPLNYEISEEPPPVYYLRLYLTESNKISEGAVDELANIVAISIKRMKMPFSTATTLDVAKASPLFYAIEKSTDLLLVPTKTSIVFQYLCGLSYRLADVFVFKGNATYQSLLGTANNFTELTVFNHSLVLTWIGVTKSCAMMFIDGSEYDKYENYRFSYPRPDDPFVLSAEKKPDAVAICAVNTAYEEFSLQAFFVEELSIPPGATLFIYRGAPTDNQNLLYTIRHDSQNISYPLIFNGLLYSFVLHNGSATLKFATTFNVDKFTNRELRIPPDGYMTGFLFQGSQTTYFSLFTEGHGGFSIQPDFSAFSYGPRDGIVQHNSTRLYLPFVSPNGNITIRIESSTSRNNYLFYQLLVFVRSLQVVVGNKET